MAYMNNEHIYLTAEMTGVVNIDNEYDPTSENAQSGKAVAEALSGVNGIKYITEPVWAEDLDYGIYIIDEENGGAVEFNDLRFNNIFGLNNITSGALIVTPYWATDKMFTVFTNDINYYMLILQSVYSGGEWLFDDYTYTYANTKYVDEQIKTLDDKVKEDLTEEINTALEQAKASGEFDGADGKDGANGKDGTSVTVASVSESTADGGNNVVTFSDGKTLTVKNGSKGSKGDKGDKGDTGATGSKGADGKTPVKGTDYFTETDKTEMVESVVASMEGIPDYWLSHLEERVDDIRRAMEIAGRNKSSFFFYSDAHWSNETTYTSKMSPKLLKYLYKKTPINYTNFGGDIVSAESTDTDIMAYLWDWREQLRELPNHHSVIGNHDDGNSTNNLFSKEYIYSYLLAPEESNDIVWGDGFYYYIDNTSEKTRYLYLDTMYEGVSDTQLAWVEESLISVPTDWHIVAITHAWYKNDYTNYPPVLNGFDTNAQKFLDMFDSYNSRSGVYAECGGFVSLCIGGHYHLDHYEHTTGGIPVIIVEADTFHDRGGTMPTHGNTGEASISAVIVDYNNSVVKVIRIGRGDSYEVPINLKTTAYTNVIPLSIGADGNIFNGGKGWADTSRIGSGKLDGYIGKGTYYITGHIPIDQTIANTFRFRNFPFDSTTTDTYIGMAFYDENFTRVVPDTGGSSNWTKPTVIANTTNAYNAILDGTNIIQFTMSPTIHINNAAVKYVAFCTTYIGEDSIITVNEPIE